MSKKVTRYIISYTANTGERRQLSKEYEKKSNATKEKKRLLAPGKLNVKGDERTRRTAPRNTLPYGFNNPRIIKRKLLR